MERIEHKVGEIFEYEEEKIITVEVEKGLCCHKCIFLFVGDCGGNICLGNERKDGKNVVFKFADYKR